MNLQNVNEKKQMLKFLYKKLNSSPKMDAGIEEEKHC